MILMTRQDKDPGPRVGASVSAGQPLPSGNWMDDGQGEVTSFTTETIWVLLAVDPGLLGPGEERKEPQGQNSPAENKAGAASTSEGGARLDAEDQAPADAAACPQGWERQRPGLCW